MALATLVLANWVLILALLAALWAFGRAFPGAAGTSPLLRCGVVMAAGVGLIEFLGVNGSRRYGWLLAVANGLLVLGFALLNQGIAQRRGRRRGRLTWHLAGIAVMVVIYAAFTGVHDNLGVRATLVGSAMGVELSLGAIWFRRAGQRLAFRAMAAFAGFNFLRGPVTWLAAPHPRRLEIVLLVTDYAFLLFTIGLALALMWWVIAGLRERFAQLAFTDELTGLANRRALETEIERLLPHPPLACVAMDLDHFKAINDRWGHAAGDFAIRKVAAFLAAHAAKLPGAVAARTGGDEFFVLLPRHDAAAAAQVAEYWRTELARIRLTFESHPLTLQASFGIDAVSESAAGETERGGLPVGSSALRRRADLALYVAKEAGRNCVRVAPGQGSEPDARGGALAGAAAPAAGGSAPR